MKWPWKKPRPDPHDLEEARSALAKACADEPRVASVVEDLHRKQAENHFGPRIHSALSAHPRKRHP